MPNGSNEPENVVSRAEHQLGVSAGYSVLHHDRWVKTLAILEKHCPPKTHPKVLDVGVWPGYQSLALKIFGYDVVGVDLDPSRIPNLPIETHTSNLNQDEQLPIPDETVDVVVSTEIIEHIPPLRLPIFLSAAHRALRPGGCLLISTPNRRHFGTVLKKRSPGTDAQGHGHTHEYTAKELSTYFSPSEWRAEVHTVDMYVNVGTVTTQAYYRPLWQWWRHPRKLHNCLKVIAGLLQKVFPPIRDTLIVFAAK